ncbi:acyltransferase family protein [Elizabethkingia argentiflava]|uniref:Acyltransferase family protein n=1 Tax=Elizabethkingia argenteiflava TaxID=2681556 RepID=A0A845PWI6_9FLAO|nr:acyltransferase [Elizabethkingia argenteiflava]NAW51331.1 acyltransferase family protein [Elizabethkingia argenteiflava]
MSNKIKSLQIIRCIAAILVAICHIWNDGWLADCFVEFGAKFGVDLFFVLSGFMMCLTVKFTVGNCYQNAVYFLKKRIIRIFPIYILFAIPLLIFNIKAEGLKSFYFYLGNLLLFPSFDNDADYHLVLGPGWTLVYEMLFYYVFSFFMLMMSSKDRLLGMNVIFLVFVVGIVNITGLQGDLLGWVNFSYIIGDSLLLNFALGIVCYYFFMYFRHKVKLNYKLSFLLLLLIAISILYLNAKITLPRVLIFGIPAFIVICIFSITTNPQVENKIYRRVIFIGDASYSIYLIHYYAAFFKPKILLLKNYFTMDFDVFLNIVDILLLGAAVLVGSLFYAWLERPLLNILSQKSLYKRMANINS